MDNQRSAENAPALFLIDLRIIMNLTILLKGKTKNSQDFFGAKTEAAPAPVPSGTADTHKRLSLFKKRPLRRPPQKMLYIMVGNPGNLRTKKAGSPKKIF